MATAVLRFVRRLPAPSHFAGWVLSALALRRQRVRLATLDAAILADIGITRDRALAEANRPFWDAPHHWSL